MFSHEELNEYEYVYESIIGNYEEVERLYKSTKRLQIKNKDNLQENNPYILYIDNEVMKLDSKGQQLVSKCIDKVLEEELEDKRFETVRTSI